MNLDELLGIDPDDPVQRLADRLVQSDENLLDALIERRIAAKLTREQVAERIGVSESTVARMESGERDPRLSLVRLYALAVGADVRHQVTPHRQAETTRAIVNEMLERQPGAWSRFAMGEHDRATEGVSRGISSALLLIATGKRP